MTKGTESPKLPLDGRRTIDNIWSRMRQLTSRERRYGVRAQDVRIILRLESTFRDQNQD